MTLHNWHRWHERNEQHTFHNDEQDVTQHGERRTKNKEWKNERTDWIGNLVLRLTQQNMQVWLAQCSRRVRSFIHYQTCEHTVLKTNEPNLLQIGTSGLRGKEIKWSPFAVSRSKIKVTGGRRGSNSWTCMIFWKWMNRFCRKLAQVVDDARRWNDFGVRRSKVKVKWCGS